MGLGSFSQTTVYQLTGAGAVRYELGITLPAGDPVDIDAVIEPYRARLIAMLRDNPAVPRFAAFQTQARALSRKCDDEQARLAQLQAERQQALASPGDDLADALDRILTATAELQVKLPALKETCKTLTIQADAARHDFVTALQMAGMRIGQDARLNLEAEAQALADELMALPGVAERLAKIGTLQAAITAISFRQQHEAGVEAVLNPPTAAEANEVPWRD